MNGLDSPRRLENRDRIRDFQSLDHSSSHVIVIP